MEEFEVHQNRKARSPRQASASAQICPVYGVQRQATSIYSSLHTPLSSSSVTKPDVSQIVQHVTSTVQAHQRLLVKLSSPASSCQPLDAPCASMRVIPGSLAVPMLPSCTSLSRGQTLQTLSFSSCYVHYGCRQRRASHHPLFANFSPSLNLSTFNPTIASPRSVLTSASIFASRKWVTACTIAFALTAALPLL